MRLGGRADHHIGFTSVLYNASITLTFSALSWYVMVLLGINLNARVRLFTNRSPRKGCKLHNMAFVFLHYIISVIIHVDYYMYGPHMSTHYTPQTDLFKMIILQNGIIK